MTQIATVEAVPAPGVALVRVARQTACGHDCENCPGCGVQGTSVTVRARTELPVAPGDRVELSAGGGRVLAIAALVYLAPVALFLAGYLLSWALPEGGRYLCGGLGFVLGLLLAALWDRRLRREGRTVTHQIVRRL